MFQIDPELFNAVAGNPTTLADVGAALDKLADDTDYKIRHVDAAPGRTIDWKAEQRTRIRTEQEAAATKIFTDAAAKADRAREDAQRNLTGLIGLRGDPGSVAISYRDALDRAERATDEERLALMHRGMRSGDLALVRACLAAAIEAVDIDTMNAYIEVYPSAEPALQAAVNAAPGSGDILRGTLALSNALSRALDATPRSTSVWPVGNGASRGRSAGEAWQPNMLASRAPGEWAAYPGYDSGGHYTG